MRAVYFHQAAQVPADLNAALQAFPQVILVSASDPGELPAALENAEILIINNRSYTPDTAKIIREHGGALRWIQFSTSGIDKAVASGLPSGVVVTNVAGLRAFAVAEQALLLMLGLVRHMRSTEVAREKAFWIRDEITPAMDNLAGKHLVIIGVGAVGQEIARKAKAFDMRVTGISRAAGPIPDIDELRPRSELIAACANADMVVIAAGHDSTTEKILSRDAIAAMKPSAYVVNIARGQLVDEPALIEALQSKKLAGAGVDVAATEPLPSGHPFWGMNNVIMTPHIGGAGSQGVGGGLGAIFAANLERWLNGQTLTKVVIARTP